MEQGSEDWFRARKGRLTASQMAKVITPTGKLSSQWEKLAIRLAGECVKPNEIPTFMGNIHTDRGHEMEPVARDWFAEWSGLDVRTVGFVTKDDNPVLGCSPDALVYDKGVIGTDKDGVAYYQIEPKPICGVEIKCPLIENHALYHYEGGVPEQYRAQVHGSMVVTGLREWWFVSFNEGTEPFTHLQTWDEYTDKVAEALDEFVTKYAPIRSEVLHKLTKKQNAPRRRKSVA
jgi:putative phage-type endonuclease